MKRVDPASVVNAEPLLRGPGRRLPGTMAAIAERDALLREVARLHFPAVSQREQARRVHDALCRYQSGAWRRERAEAEGAARHHGKINAHCHAILSLRDHVPSEGAIRRALAFREPAKRPSCGE